VELRKDLDLELERPRTPECPLCYQSFSSMVSMMVHRSKMHPQAWAGLKPQLEAQKRWQRRQQQAWLEKDKAIKQQAKQRKKDCWYAIDVETNKNNVMEERHAEIIEMAIVEIYPYARKEEQNIKLVEHRRYRPTQPITESASKIHGIKMEHLAEEPYFTRVDAYRIVDLISGSAGVVAHNYDYDKNVLSDQFARVGLPRLLDDSKALRTRFCTQSGTYSAGYSKKANVRLSEAVKGVLGIGNYKGHKAKDDAMASASLFLALTQQHDGMIVYPWQAY
jgi:DNA polymerase III epsilon subunit-like protein